MIIIKIKGGLGNQMFQYALARHLSIKNNCRLFLDIREYENDNLRKFRLDNYLLGEHKIIRKQEGLQKFIHQVKRKIKKVSTYAESSLGFNPDVLALNNVYLDGYWQTEKYFSEIREILLHDFSIKKPLQSNLIQDLEKIKSSDSISVHIRRGDYTHAKNIETHGIIELSWYENAITFIKNHVKKPEFFFFSDDIEFTKSIFPTKNNHHYMKTSPEGFEHEDLFLMSKCKHNIIANSSFSWWAAWLNTNPNKYVIAPQKWFATEDLETKDIIPINWIKM